MIEKDLIKIGNRIYEARKRRGMTQAEAAEAAEISDRTFADIERGNVNMRIETMAAICGALGITPDELFLTEDDKADETEIIRLLAGCTGKEKDTALKLLQAYLSSLS